MSLTVPTPHINAKKGDFAKTVLMPGDPLRAKYIAETYLENVRQVTSVRNVLGFTGTYKGKEVSVMASGMGIPSISIYSYELFEGYGVENIIRVGTAGALSPKLNIGDIVVGMGACTNSAVIKESGLKGFAPIADYNLLHTLCLVAEKHETKVKVGNLFSSDLFYGSGEDFVQKWSSVGTLAVEMEAAGLYLNAAKLGKKALAICTISDSLVTGEATTSEQRQTSFNEMMILALETAISL
ncbi:MAG: purine-nucleoside phosphorylase [Clostridia bacterium]|nr:purine-nucleoside phosphorylase [Clostridia bacterium]MBQ9919384.1 purine-nucleoside phosphorylase [Clostridia bacterium]